MPQSKLVLANQTLFEAKKHHDTTIQIQPIRVEDFRFLAFSDASFASKGSHNSQTGILIMGTHKGYPEQHQLSGQSISVGL